MAFNIGHVCVHEDIRTYQPRWRRVLSRPAIRTDMCISNELNILNNSLFYSIQGGAVGFHGVSGLYTYLTLG